MFCYYLFLNNLQVSPEPGEQLGMERAQHVGFRFQLATHQAARVTRTWDEHTVLESISGFNALDDLLCNGVVELPVGLNQLFHVILKWEIIDIITYVTNYIYVPKDVIETIDKLLYEFVWKKKHRVKRSTMIEKIAKGELKMPDTTAVIKSNKLNLIKRLINTENNCNTTAAFILKTNDVERFLTYKK